MAVRRLLVAASVALVAVAGVVSATSLGTFDLVTMSASTHSVTACTADADLLDLSGNVIPLNVNLNLIPIDAVRLSNLAGDCDGTVPQVVVIGEDPALTADRVLDISDPLLAFDPSVDPQNITLDVDDSLRSLLDVLDLKRITELRTGFVPT